MQIEKQQPYFFNPDMHPVQLEEWLNQQKNHVASYNPLCRERATLIEQPEQVEETLKRRSSSGFEYALLVDHYIKDISRRALGSKLKLSEGMIRITFQMAEGFIDGCLSMLNVKLEMDNSF